MCEELHAKVRYEIPDKLYGVLGTSKQGWYNEDGYAEELRLRMLDLCIEFLQEPRINPWINPLPWNISDCNVTPHDIQRLSVLTGKPI